MSVIFVTLLLLPGWMDIRPLGRDELDLAILLDRWAMWSRDAGVNGAKLTERPHDKSPMPRQEEILQ